MDGGSSPLARGLRLPKTELPRLAGSSPLARGLRGRRAGMLSVLRIIPARAGFTGRYTLARATERDHPRSRGVYLLSVYLYRLSIGSSPLARGLHTAARGHGAGAGIIPARAGFTVQYIRAHASAPDHPRSRGVYGRGSAGRRRKCGSSPLARGLRAKMRPTARACRIIPARAGFTNPCPHKETDHKDHPRSRGVYRMCRVGGVWGLGSSPLARGLLPPPPPPG